MVEGAGRNTRMYDNVGCMNSMGNLTWISKEQRYTMQGSFKERRASTHGSRFTPCLINVLVDDGLPCVQSNTIIEPVCPQGCMNYLILPSSHLKISKLRHYFPR
jgi:hypothetical protein